MTDDDGIRFLQWALPRLGLRWPGFRKVRRQVYRRLDDRLKVLHLADLAAYRAYLELHAPEWDQLDALCRISISRFHRDKGVFQYLERDVLPALARLATGRGDGTLSCWSLGCAAGEEPYTVAILWRLRVAPDYPHLRCRILATDADGEAIRRAEHGCYKASSLKDLPPNWIAEAFTHAPEGFRVKPEYRALVTFQQQDVRTALPQDQFHVVLCRNVAFTYFDEIAQRQTLERIRSRLWPGGALVIGGTESLPAEAQGFEPWDGRWRVYRRQATLGDGPRARETSASQRQETCQRGSMDSVEFSDARPPSRKDVDHGPSKEATAIPAIAQGRPAPRGEDAAAPSPATTKDRAWCGAQGHHAAGSWRGPSGPLGSDEAEDQEGLGEAQPAELWPRRSEETDRAGRP
jgi:chemotaxis protein methyltransferase CheR